MEHESPYKNLEKTLTVDGKDYTYFDFTALNDDRIGNII